MRVKTLLATTFTLIVLFLIVRVGVLEWRQALLNNPPKDKTEWACEEGKWMTKCTDISGIICYIQAHSGSMQCGLWAK